MVREVAVGLALEEIYEVENENMNYNFYDVSRTMWKLQLE